MGKVWTLSEFLEWFKMLSLLVRVNGIAQKGLFFELRKFVSLLLLLFKFFHLNDAVS